jgi:hypothetical protein
MQVLWGLKLTQFWGPRMQNYEYKIRYESEYLFRAPPRVLEGALKLKIHRPHRKSAPGWGGWSAFGHARVTPTKEPRCPLYRPGEHQGRSRRV